MEDNYKKNNNESEVVSKSVTKSIKTRVVNTLVGNDWSQQ